ncbi:MAG: hypothetical protein EPO13_04435 [Actinomycetota bacterium]|nr:MAG: hypothetical protein EPO13_04435 [Actinomycetota bacterium]
MPQTSSAPGQQSAPEQLNYAGAIYGSLLAASTIIGTAATADDLPEPGQLLAAVAVTATVFWLLHVYVRVIGEELPRGHRVTAAVRRAAALESPILAAAAVPTVVLLLAVAADEPGDWTAATSLAAALVTQVVATWLALRATGARRLAVVLGVIVSIALGIGLILLKALLTH